MNKVNSKPDSIDEQIIGLLTEDGRQDSETLAKKLGLSAATVRRRLKKLTESGAMRIVAVIDPTKFSLALSAVIAFDVANGKLLPVLDALAKLPEIRWVATTMGRYDVIAQGRFASNEHLAEFVENKLPKIKGIRDSETFVCLEPKQRRNYIPLVGLTLENKRI